MPGDEQWGDNFGLPSPDGSILCAVRFGTDLIVGGTFHQIGGVGANYIARWDGSSWNSMGGGFNREVTCLAVYQGALFAGGPFQYVEGRFTQHLAKWDGSQRSLIPILREPMCAHTVHSCVVSTAIAKQHDAAGSVPGPG